ncbi:MAG: hypothetical protein KJZ92_14055 [Rhodocyclaceae bacterium]|nr:hypothetical protein [Rhodocyclaceae bacterium]
MKRDYHGYLQVRECAGEPWRFCVSGFDHTRTGQDGRCTVLKVGGSREWVPIDAQDRITIRGRKYGRNRWIH